MFEYAGQRHETHADLIESIAANWFVPGARIDHLDPDAEARECVDQLVVLGYVRRWQCGEIALHGDLSAAFARRIELQREDIAFGGW